MSNLQKIFIFIILILVAGGIFWYFSRSPGGEEISTLGERSQEVLTAENMKITSPAFANHQSIPAKYTCDGGDVNPPLIISGVPENAKSLVLIVDDPDAPGGTWVHWTVWNITPEISEIAEDNVPEGTVEGITDFGSNKYGGPCPPSGTHRYFFKLYALDTILELGSSAKVKDIEQAMEGHILAEAQLVGLYSRQ